MEESDSLKLGIDGIAETFEHEKALIKNLEVEKHKWFPVGMEQPDANLLSFIRG